MWRQFQGESLNVQSLITYHLPPITQYHVH